MIKIEKEKRRAINAGIVDGVALTCLGLGRQTFSSSSRETP